MKVIHIEHKDGTSTNVPVTEFSLNSGVLGFKTKSGKEYQFEIDTVKRWHVTDGW